MVEVEPSHQPVADILHSLGIEKTVRGNAIGTLVLCGQGPILDRATSIKLQTQNDIFPNADINPSANSWMRLIARAGGILDSTGEVGLLIPSGKNTGGIGPTEAELMEKIMKNIYGKKRGEGRKFLNADLILEERAHNTLLNIINTANIIDDERRRNPDNPDLENVWFIGSHFHVPRLKLLASLFGFDPKKVLSAEEVLLAQSKQTERQARNSAVVADNLFNRQFWFRQLLRTRLGQSLPDRSGEYFQRKLGRAKRRFGQILHTEISGEIIDDHIEEGKNVHQRMRSERRWMRGIVEVPEYIVPLGAALIDDTRYKNFLAHFTDLEKEELGLDDSLPLSQTRENLRDRWDWRGVQKTWEDEEYSDSLKAQLWALGLDGETIEQVSKAEVPPLNEPDARYSTLYLVRHGQSDRNVQSVVQGQSNDSHLTQVGKQQALELSNNLSDLGISVIISSDIARSLETAQIIAAQLGKDVQEDSRLRERNFGEFTGQPSSSVAPLFEERDKRPSTHTRFTHNLHPNVEDDQELALRGFEALREIVFLHQGEKVAVVSHHGMMTAILVALGFDYDEIRTIDNTGIVEIQSDGLDFLVKSIEGVYPKKDQRVY